jgi:hypothetical protein
MLMIAGLVVAGCGTATPPKYLPGLKPLPTNASPTAVVQHAYGSLVHSSYDEVARSTVSFNTSRLPAVEAARLEANLSHLEITVTASATFSDFSDFRMTEHVNGRTVMLRASRGVYSFSPDGVSYTPMPADQASSLFGALQGGLASIAARLTNVRAVGIEHVDGITVQRYTASLSGQAALRVGRSLLSSVGRTIGAGVSQGTVAEMFYIDRRTGFPVRIRTFDRGFVNLASLHHAGVSGILGMTVSTTRSFSHFRNHRTPAPAP